MVISVKSALAVLGVSLLCLHLGHAAHAAGGPLDAIDNRLVAENFRLESIAGVGSDVAAPDSMPGCADAKVFQVFEAGAPGQIVVTLCKQGEFGPSKIEATLAEQGAQAREAFKRMPAPAVQFLLSGAEPVAVPLGDQSNGMVATLPYVGHGIVLITLAYAITPAKDATIVMQIAMNPDNPRNLNKPAAALLQAIYRRLEQDKG